MERTEFRFSMPIQVRWRDLDALGHVNNAVYLTYLEHARVGYVRALGLASGDPADIGFILAQVTCTYRSPLEMGEEVVVWLKTVELGNSSFVFEYRIEGDGGRLAATARSVQVCYDYQNGHSVPIPDWWRERIIAYEPGLDADSDPSRHQ